MYVESALAFTPPNLSDPSAGARYCAVRYELDEYLDAGSTW
jgi:hypothetical protein